MPGNILPDFRPLVESENLAKLSENPDKTVVGAIIKLSNHFRGTAGKGRRSGMALGQSPVRDLWASASNPPQDVLQAASLINSPELDPRSLADGTKTDILIMKRALLIIVRDLLGLPDTGSPEETGGICCPGGSTANELALDIVSEKGKEEGRDTILCANTSHLSLRMACRKMRMGLTAFERRPDKLDTIPKAALTTAIRDQCKKLAALVLTCPDTSFGVNELIDTNTADACKTEGIPIVVDAAFALSRLSCSEPDVGLKQLINHPAVQIVTTDLHKVVGMQGSAAVFLKNPTDIGYVSQNNPYFVSAPEVYFGTSINCAPMISSLMHLHTLGRKGLRERFDNWHEQARDLGERLKPAGFELFADPVGRIVPIKLEEGEKYRAMQGLGNAGISVSSIGVPFNIMTGKSVTMHGIRCVMHGGPGCNDANLKSFPGDLLRALGKRI